VAVGNRSTANGQGAVAIGDANNAAGFGAVAMGFSSNATASNALALGSSSTASASAAVALGNGANATTLGSMAMGSSAQATGGVSTAIGYLSQATQAFTTAIGEKASATSEQATAIGGDSVASGGRSLAVGANARATFTNSTAIGANSATTKDYQVMIGSSGTSVAIADIAASDAAQTGAEYYVTVDSNGTLGRGGQSGASLVSMQQSAAIEGLQAQQAVIDDTVASQGRQINQLFDLAAYDRRESRRGTAAAMAMAAPGFPSKPGGTSWLANTAVYGGQVAFSASLAHRFSSSPIMLHAGVSHAAGAHSTGARVGIGGEF
jgi:autotransporter adhesin